MFIKPCNGLVNSLFSQNRLHPKLGVFRPHNGVDFTSSPDNTIIAAASGKVVRARTTEDDGYGKFIAIEHNDNGQVMTTLYAHLDSLTVKNGQTVKQGEKIGIKGNTGLSHGTHLHFEIRVGKFENKKYVDPLPFIQCNETLEIQLMLNKVGYIIRSDGYYGDKTITTVADFQEKHGLTVDGVAGRVTHAKLKAEAAKVPTLKELKEGVVKVAKPKDDGQFAKAADTHLAGQEFVMAAKISNGEYPGEYVTRQQLWTTIMNAHNHTMKEVAKLLENL